jgi:hypothetical protein
VVRASPSEDRGGSGVPGRDSRVLVGAVGDGREGRVVLGLDRRCGLGTSLTRASCEAAATAAGSDARGADPTNSYGSYPAVNRVERIVNQLRGFGGWRPAWRRAPIVGEPQDGMPGVTAATTTPLQSNFGPIVADAAGTITVQEASDLLDLSRLRVCQLLNPSAGRVLVTDVLALKSLVPPSALEAPAAAKPVS